MISAICSHSQQSLCFASAHSRHAMPCLCLNSWHLVKHKCQGFMSGAGHSRYLCTSIGWLTSWFFVFCFFCKSWLSPYWSVLAWHSRHLVLLHFESLVNVKQEIQLNWECWHNKLLIFFSLFVLHQQWTCAFHCPKKSLNIPLLHVLVIILPVFFYRTHP